MKGVEVLANILRKNQLQIKTIFSNSIVSSVLYTLKYLTGSNTSQEIVFVIEYIISPFLIFITDVLLIQEIFLVNEKLSILPILSFKDRITYGMRLTIFYKFIVTIMISSIINRSIFEYIIKRLDNNKIMIKNSGKRNVVVGILVNIFATVVYINALKFKWAYINSDNILLNMLIISWFSLTILISTIGK
jgi:hypothetical protein